MEQRRPVFERVGEDAAQIEGSNLPQGCVERGRKLRRPQQDDEIRRGAMPAIGGRLFAAVHGRPFILRFLLACMPVPAGNGLYLFRDIYRDAASRIIGMSQRGEFYKLLDKRGHP